MVMVQMFWPRYLLLVCWMVPIGTAVAALHVSGLQPQECFDARFHFKLLLWGPVVEELVFRAGLQKLLMRKVEHSFVAIGITSVVFSLMHYGLSGNLESLAVFVPSVALGWVYQRTGSLLWTIALHIAFNLMFVVRTCVVNMPNLF
jgi:uncharacterized protein